MTTYQAAASSEKEADSLFSAVRLTNLGRWFQAKTTADTMANDDFFSLEFSRRWLDSDNEEVEYWRQKYGWYDDDAKMKQYNEDAQYHRYNPTFDVTDDEPVEYPQSGGIVWNLIGVAVLLIAFAAVVLVARAIKRKLDRSDKSKESSQSTEKSRSRSRGSSRGTSSRTRSRSRTRTRSRSRAKGAADGDYKLMDDKEISSKRSHSRSRSKSTSGRSSSRKRSSRSRSRARDRDSSRSGEAEIV